MALALIFMLSCVTSSDIIAQNNDSPNGDCYWQQHVDYKMEIDMDVSSYQYKGKQSIIYTNNSPDILNRVYYHLYFNAFQPGSEMDIRSRTIADPDGQRQKSPRPR